MCGYHLTLSSCNSSISLPHYMNNTCSRLTRDFFVQNLNISKHDADKIVFVRCHRVGKKSPTVKRPMIVRFQCYADRQLVWNTRFHLKNKAFSLHENFASGVEYRRKLLYPIMSKARKSDKYQRVYLNGDILKINGRDYTVDDLGVLPKDLHPNMVWYGNCLFDKIKSTLKHNSKYIISES